MKDENYYICDGSLFDEDLCFTDQHGKDYDVVGWASGYYLIKPVSAEDNSDSAHVGFLIE